MPHLQPTHLHVLAAWATRQIGVPFGPSCQSRSCFAPCVSVPRTLLHAFCWPLILEAAQPSADAPAPFPGLMRADTDRKPGRADILPPTTCNPLLYQDFFSSSFLNNWVSRVLNSLILCSFSSHRRHPCTPTLCYEYSPTERLFCSQISWAKWLLLTP